MKRKVVGLLRKTKRIFLGLLKKFLTSNGLIATLLVGILINLSSQQINEIVARQRFYEMLQYELRSDLLIAGQVEKFYSADGEIRNQNYFKNEVYLSGINNGYFLSIDPKYLIKISTYYSMVPLYNDLLKKTYERIDEADNNWQRCSIGIIAGENKSCELEKKKLDESSKLYSQQIEKLWRQVYNSSLSDIAINYNPTAKRMHSPFLKLLMGTDTMEFLK